VLAIPCAHGFQESACQIAFDLNLVGMTNLITANSLVRTAVRRILCPYVESCQAKLLVNEYRTYFLVDLTIDHSTNPHFLALSNKVNAIQPLERRKWAGMTNLGIRSISLGFPPRQTT
jgi:hypothetical protein